MRSKKRTIGILIVVIVAFLGFAGSLLVYRNKLSSENTINDSDGYTAVDRELYEEIVNGEFKNASLKERKEIAFNLLKDLENKGKIKKDSIIFNDRFNCYFFEYLNGAEGTIILNDLSGITESSNRNSVNIDEDYAKSKNNEIRENLQENNLTYKQGNLSAVIIECLGNGNNKKEKVAWDNIRSILEENQQTWTSNGLKTDIKHNATVKEFKTILNKYDFIDIRCHGSTDKNGDPVIVLQEEMNPFENYYSDDRDAKRIGTIFGSFGGEYYLKSDFFSFYYSGQLIDKIVWLGCCSGYSNDNLVNVFAENCKAKSVIGATDEVSSEYGTYMTDSFIYKLLYGHNVNESLDFSKTFWGKTDSEFAQRMNYKIDNTPAEFKNYNGGDEKLVELVSINTNGTLSGTVKDENGNPIKGAEIGIHNVRGMSHGITATTNENGKYTLECPQDSYKIGVKADSYEVFETDDFVNVVYGKETIFNITLKKVIEPTDPIEPTSNYLAVDLIDKIIPEIISLMNGEYQIIKTENDGYIYIQNQSVLSGMEFYIQVSGDDIMSANNGEEIHSDTLKAKLESGELTLDGIQVNKSGKVSETIQADMDYKSCSKVLDDFNCIGDTGGYLGGDVSSLSYEYNENNAKVILNFEIPEEIYRDLILGKISSVSAEEMKSYNPNLRNVVIRKADTEATTNIVDSGTCGDNLTWTLDSNGQLTIEGTGEMYNYYTPYNKKANSSPWHSQKIKSVVIKSGVTSIGNGAFGWQDYLENVSIANTVTSIGVYSFFSCDRLGYLFQIPESVTFIGKGAFDLCCNTRLLYVGKNVTNIEDYSFDNTYLLTIYGYNNTEAQTYAQNNNISFVCVDDDYGYHGTISNQNGASFRSGSSEKSKEIYIIPYGTEVSEYDSIGDWALIKYNGTLGYVYKDDLLFEGGFAKPVIYLYPEKKQDISVKVNFKNGDFTCTYPEYNNGWNVTAYPDGKIINKADNDEYSYLYWEGEGKIDYDFSSGFVVKKEDTAKFLKEKLSYMGLSPKEYNEFIVYWLPIMQKNEYNLISFQTDNYEESAKLEISPKPDNMLRVFMAFKKVTSDTAIPEQKIEPFKRKGFTVIEWGGTEVN